MSEWRSIPGIPNYQVSEDGNVRRARAWRGREDVAVCIKDNGYAEVKLTKDGARKAFLVHRHVATAFISLPPTAEHEVAHNDGIRHNNHFKNLRWATHQENMDDMILHGTRAKGERSNRASLTATQVIEIRERLKSGGITQSALAKQYGVVHQTISWIASGKRWGHLIEVTA